MKTMRSEPIITDGFPLPPYRHKRPAGVVLVGVLWTVMLLLVIVATLVRTSRIDRKSTVFSAQSVRCQWVCRAGFETAIALLNRDSTASDTLTDLWSDNDDDLVEVVMDDAYFTVRVVDEAGKLNINTATKEQLLGLPDMEESIAAAIIDWRDRDDNPQDQGAETGYYRNLTYPYTIRNGPFKTLRELLLVKGVTERLLYGEDTNLNGELDYNERDGDLSPPQDNRDDVLDQGWIAFLTCYSKDDNQDATGQSRVNVNEASQQELEQQLNLRTSYARWIVDHRGNGFGSIADLIADNSPDQPQDSGESSDQAEPIDLQTFQGIADRITVTGDNETRPKVNVNTAPQQVLALLFEDTADAEKMAAKIVQYRDGLAYGLESIGDLLNVESLTKDRFKKIADLVTVRSNVYTIYSRAWTVSRDISGATRRIEAVVERGRKPCRVAYWYQGASY